MEGHGKNSLGSTVLFLIPLLHQQLEQLCVPCLVPLQEMIPQEWLVEVTVL